MINVYDDQNFFNEYNSMRDEKINANNLIENPIIKSMLPDVNNKTILDLGCGDGNMDKYFETLGASKIVGIDISQNMINKAKEINASDKIEYLNMSMEEIVTLPEKFDIVYSSLAFHYIKDFDKLISDINSLLKTNGLLIFSQESPLTTALVLDTEKYDKKVVIEDKVYYLISDYSNIGERIKIWNNTPVTKYHRTYCSIVKSLIDNNFKILDLKDSFATEETIKLREKYKHELDRPMFTFFKVQKI